MQLDSSSLVLIIGAIALGATQVISAYFQGKRLLEVKDDIKQTKNDMTDKLDANARVVRSELVKATEAVKEQQATDSKKLDIIHESTNGSLSKLQAQLETATKEITTLRERNHSSTNLEQAVKILTEKISLLEGQVKLSGDAK